MTFASPATGETGRRMWQFQAPAPATGTHDCDSPTFRHQTSEKSRRLQADIQRVARFPFNILITGETGTGKTMAARQIHRRSARAGKPFMELNCANLPEQLVEAELFGYRKGSFTGADRDHRGLFEEADGGTLFLDEIGDVPVAVQNKLLRAIEEKQIKRLGTNSYVQCDVQIVAATSRRLPEMIRRGEFRQDCTAASPCSRLKWPHCASGVKTSRRSLTSICERRPAPSPAATTKARLTS
jgi:sigma-54 dependent transcriptional regulator